MLIESNILKYFIEDNEYRIITILNYATNDSNLKFICEGFKKIALNCDYNGDYNIQVKLQVKDIDTLVYITIRQDLSIYSNFASVYQDITINKLFKRLFMTKNILNDKGNI